MKKSFVKNAADPKQIKEAEEKVKVAEHNQDADMLFLLQTEQGQRVFWDLLSFCGVYRSSFNHSGSITNYNEGMRSVGLKLLADITKSAPDILIGMMKRNNGE